MSEQMEMGTPESAHPNEVSTAWRFYSEYIRWGWGPVAGKIPMDLFDTFLRVKTPCCKK